MQKVFAASLCFGCQEKAVQDRLIRETQDALLDKVSLAELNMFEARLNTFICARIVSHFFDKFMLV